MSLILGTEYCKLDSNGRFKFPIALKKQMGTDDARFFVRKSDYAECLELWTFDNYSAELRKLQNQLNYYNIDDRDMLRRFSAGNVIELDSSDRLVLPPEQKEHFKNAKDLVLQSLGPFIEVWERSEYQKLNDKPIDSASKANERLGSISGADLQEGSK